MQSSISGFNSNSAYILVIPFKIAPLVKNFIGKFLFNLIG